MPGKSTRVKVFLLCVLLLIILVAGIFYQSLGGLSMPEVYEDSEPLEGVTTADLFEFREKNFVFFLSPKEVERARKIVRQ